MTPQEEPQARPAPQQAKPLYYTDENGTLCWNPHAGQKRGWNSKASRIMSLKPWRAGFTSSSAKWLLDEMKRCGPCSGEQQYFGMAPTLKIAGDGIIPSWIALLETELRIARYNRGHHFFTILPEGEEFLWGHRQKHLTKIKVCHASDPSSFAAATFLAGVADEITMSDFKRESWTTLETRMATVSGWEAPNNPKGWEGVRMGRIFAGSTVYTHNWVKDLFDEYVKAYKALKADYDARIAGAQSADEKRELRAEFRALVEDGRKVYPHADFIRYDTFANPSIDREFIENKRKTLPDWYYKQRFQAIFSRPAGRIFEKWDKAKHVVQPFHLPSHWPRWASCDFGKKNFHATLWAYDPKTGRVFCYASYHRNDLSSRDHGKGLKAFAPRLANCVAGQISEEEDRADLAVGGLPAMAPTYKPLWKGINDLSAAIAKDKVYVFATVPLDALPDECQEEYPRDPENGNQLPLGFQVGCPGLVEELGIYSRPVDDNGMVIQDADPENKESAHWCDTLRYLATHLFAGWFGMDELQKDHTGKKDALTPERKALRPAERAARAHNEGTSARAGDERLSSGAQAVKALRRGLAGARGKFRLRRYGPDAGCFEPPVEKFM